MENSGYTKLERLKCIEEYFEKNFPSASRNKPLNRDEVELSDHYKQIEAFYLLYRMPLDPSSIAKSEYVYYHVATARRRLGNSQARS